MRKNNLKFIFIGVVIIAMLVVFLSYFNDKDVKQLSFFEETNLRNINFKQNWDSFNADLNLSKAARIEDFKLILNEKNKIYSIRFDIIDKQKDSYLIYNYSDCFSCSKEEGNRVKINKKTSQESLQYKKLVNAKDFFSQLDTLNKKGFLKNGTNKYTLISSSGVNEEIGIKGEYFVLENNQLKKITQQYSKGFNILLLSNSIPENFITNERTRIIITKNS